MANSPIPASSVHSNNQGPSPTNQGPQALQPQAPLPLNLLAIPNNLLPAQQHQPQSTNASAHSSALGVTTELYNGKLTITLSSNRVFLLENIHVPKAIINDRAAIENMFRALLEYSAAKENADGEDYLPPAGETCHLHIDETNGLSISRPQKNNETHTITDPAVTEACTAFARGQDTDRVIATLKTQAETMAAQSAGQSNRPSTITRTNPPPGLFNNGNNTCYIAVTAHTLFNSYVTPQVLDSAEANINDHYKHMDNSMLARKYAEALTKAEKLSQNPQRHHEVTLSPLHTAQIQQVVENDEQLGFPQAKKLLGQERQKKLALFKAVQKLRKEYDTCCQNNTKVNSSHLVNMQRALQAYNPLMFSNPGSFDNANAVISAVKDAIYTGADPENLSILPDGSSMCDHSILIENQDKQAMQNYINTYADAIQLLSHPTELDFAIEYGHGADRTCITQIDSQINLSEKHFTDRKPESYHLSTIVLHTGNNHFQAIVFQPVMKGNQLAFKKYLLNDSTRTELDDNQYAELLQKQDVIPCRVVYSKTSDVIREARKAAKAARKTDSGNGNSLKDKVKKGDDATNPNDTVNADPENDYDGEDGVDTSIIDLSIAQNGAMITTQMEDSQSQEKGNVYIDFTDSEFQTGSCPLKFRNPTASTNAKGQLAANNKLLAERHGYYPSQDTAVINHKGQEIIQTPFNSQIDNILTFGKMVDHAVCHAFNRAFNMNARGITIYLPEISGHNREEAYKIIRENIDRHAARGGPRLQNIKIVPRTQEQAEAIRQSTPTLPLSTIPGASLKTIYDVTRIQTANKKMVTLLPTIVYQTDNQNTVDTIQQSLQAQATDAIAVNTAFEGSTHRKTTRIIWQVPHDVIQSDQEIIELFSKKIRESNPKTKVEEYQLILIKLPAPHLAPQNTSPSSASSTSSTSTNAPTLLGFFL